LEKIDHDCYVPIKTALKELGFTVDYVERQAKKTVITVSRYGKSSKAPVSGEKQCGNMYEALLE